MEMENRSRILGTFSVLMILTSAINIFIVPAYANPLTEVTLSLQEEPAHADVSPESSGIVKIDGTVTCVKWGPDQVKVFLNATSTHGGASVIPPSFVFSGTGGSEDTKPFAVTTRVPQGTSSSELVTVTVSGNYVQGGLQYDIEPQSALIIVDQYYLVEANSTEGFDLTGKAGGNKDIKLNIQNAGNGNDVFEIDFQNRGDLEVKGFNLPAPKEIALPEKSNESINFAIGIPEDISGTYDMEISITSLGSMNNNEPVSQIVPINMKVLEKSIAEHIGSFIFSPLMLVVIIIVIIVAIFIKKKRSG
ncbi:MAG: hypothetical protein JSV09_09250 [Thermoplasmata archaeon]|nr:MAG: hypothetical protein JSV09_09250 [Thermoplasmata archaeon]